MDQRLLVLIGEITILWADFEYRLNTIIESMVEDGSEPGWEVRSFRKRKEMLLRIVKKNFAHSHDGISAFRAVCADAADIHWRRNVIVHGTLRFRILPQSKDTLYWSEGVHKGRLVEIPLDEENLDKLKHRIAHAIGALKCAIEMLATIEGFWPAWPDTYLLQLHEAMARQNPPKPATPQPRPQSSPS